MKIITVAYAHYAEVLLQDINSSPTAEKAVGENRLTQARKLLRKSMEHHLHSTREIVMFQVEQACVYLTQ